LPYVTTLPTDLLVLDFIEKNDGSKNQRYSVSQAYRDI
jgi:hypothetical protein